MDIVNTWCEPYVTRLITVLATYVLISCVTVAGVLCASTMEEALAPVDTDCVHDVTLGELLSEDAQNLFRVTFVHSVKSLVINRN